MGSGEPRNIVLDSLWVAWEDCQNRFSKFIFYPIEKIVEIENLSKDKFWITLDKFG
jgi:hypothetical protein